MGAEVRQKTEGKQIPFTSSGLDGDFFFILPKDGLGDIPIIYNKKTKQDNTLGGWLLLGLIVALFYLLFLLLKPKGQKSKIGRIITKPKGFIDMNELIYQNQPFTKQYSWQEAKEYAKNLKLGGFNDWRLPTREELRRLAILNFMESMTFLGKSGMKTIRIRL